MKDKITTLMKLRFASQWMEMIRHNGCMNKWRRKIKDCQMHESMTYTSVVGFWTNTPQGHDYWSARTEELDNALGI